MAITKTLHQNLLQRESSAPVNRWCVAFSGGLDSTVLLQALVALNLPEPVVAIHVNHGLSPNADAWQVHCISTCDALNVPIITESVSINLQGKGLEDAARKARFAAFSKNLQVGDVLLLGQHLDDQAETLLLRLLRGSGPKGLSAMPRERSLGDASLLRPFLGVARSELASYAKQAALVWIEDESNLSEHYDRNFLRHNVLPVLQSRWPDALARIGAAADLSREADQLLVQQAEADLSTLSVRSESLGSSLDWQGLYGHSSPQRHNILRAWLQALGFSTPEQVHLAQIDRQFFCSEVGQQPKTTVEWGNVVLRVHDARLYALERNLLWTPGANQCAVEWPDLTCEITLPGDDRLQWRRAQKKGVGLAESWLKNTTAKIAWRQGGERCHLVGKTHSESLKNRLQAWRVPLWLRSRIPLVYIESDIAAVAGYCVNRAFVTAEDEYGYLCEWSLPERPAKQ